MEEHFPSKKMVKSSTLFSRANIFTKNQTSMETVLIFLLLIIFGILCLVLTTDFYLSLDKYKMNPPLIKEKTERELLIQENKRLKEEKEILLRRMGQRSIYR